MAAGEGLPLTCAEAAERLHASAQTARVAGEAGHLYEVQVPAPPSASEPPPSTAWPTRACRAALGVRTTGSEFRALRCLRLTWRRSAAN
jgi:hypothetical protein